MPTHERANGRRACRHLRHADIAVHGLPFADYLLFGAGVRGRLTRAYFETLGARAVCCLDNRPGLHPDGLDGLEVLSPAKGLARHPGLPVFVATSHHEAVTAQLRRLGATEIFAIPGASFYAYPPYLDEARQALDAVRDMLADEVSRQVLASLVKTYVTGDEGHLIVSDYAQYLHPLAGPRDGDVVIDGGAFDGDSLRLFRSRLRRGRVVAVEPSPAAFARLGVEAARPGVACDCLNLGLWSGEDELRFCGDAGAPVGNHIAPGGSQSIRCTRIDRLVEDLGLPRVDLIKLDIEGAEMPALVGAARTIERFRPRLAVCVYHRIHDLHAIPLAIRERHPGYRFFLGHHAPDVHETVLYCL